MRRAGCLSNPTTRPISYAPDCSAWNAETSDEPPVAHPFFTLMNGTPVGPRSATMVSALPAVLAAAVRELDVVPRHTCVRERLARRVDAHRHTRSRPRGDRRDRSRRRRSQSRPHSRRILVASERIRRDARVIDGDDAHRHPDAQSRPDRSPSAGLPHGGSRGTPRSRRRTARTRRRRRRAAISARTPASSRSTAFHVPAGASLPPRSTRTPGSARGPGRSEWSSRGRLPLRAERLRPPAGQAEFRRAMLRRTQLSHERALDRECGLLSVPGALRVTGCSASGDRRRPSL